MAADPALKDLEARGEAIQALQPCLHQPGPSNLLHSCAVNDNAQLEPGKTSPTSRFSSSWEVSLTSCQLRPGSRPRVGGTFAAGLVTAGRPVRPSGVAAKMVSGRDCTGEGATLRTEGIPSLAWTGRHISEDHSISKFQQGIFHV